MMFEKKREQLADIIQKHAPLLIAYSGGVDSSLLAVLSWEILGKDGMQCVMVDGPEVPRRAFYDVLKYAEKYGFPLDVVESTPFSDELKETNPHDRCRYCKLGTYKVLDKVREKFNCRFIADGANISDLGEHRPGIEAFSSCGVIHPFIMAGITKQEIREIAKKTGLSFWNKPSSACLYSRIPYGDNISDEKLIMIEKGENILSDLGITQVRVRHHGNIARIEVIPGEMDIVYNARDQIQDAFKKIGFFYTTLDLRGYRSGSMDEPLKE